MSEEIKGILAYVTTDKNRYLGGDPIALLAKDQDELRGITEALAKTFVAEILQLQSGDYLVIKK